AARGKPPTCGGTFEHRSRLARVRRARRLCSAQANAVTRAADNPRYKGRATVHLFTLRPRGGRLRPDDLVPLRAAPNAQVYGKVGGSSPHTEHASGRKARKGFPEQQVRSVVEAQTFNIDSRRC